MSREIIAKYYLLCTTQLGGKHHILNYIPGEKLGTFFTKKELDLFLRKRDGQYIAREIVVGGEHADNHGNTIILIS